MLRADSRTGRLVRALAAKPLTDASSRYGIMQALAAQPLPSTPERQPAMEHAVVSGADRDWREAVARWAGRAAWPISVIVLGAAWYFLSDGAIWLALIVVPVMLLLGEIVERLALTLGPVLWRPKMRHRRMSTAVRLLAIVGLAALLVVVILVLADWLYGR